MNDPLRLSNFTHAHFQPNRGNDDRPAEDEEEECDCPFPWWWLLVAAAAGGGLGYYAGQRKKKSDELEAGESFVDDF